jgi:hypothetical protein
MPATYGPLCITAICTTRVALSSVGEGLKVDASLEWRRDVEK